MRAEDLGIIEPLRANISCTKSYMSVYAHVLIFNCVREMIIFTSNALAVQSDTPTPPSTYFHHNIAKFLSLICIYVICDIPEQMSGGIFIIRNTTSPPHLLYPAYPSFL